MAYDFTDKNQITKFKSRMMQKGKNPDEINRYISSKINKQSKVSAIEKGYTPSQVAQLEKLGITGDIGAISQEIESRNAAESKLVASITSGLSGLDNIERLLDKNPSKPGYQGAKLELLKEANWCGS